MPIRSDTPASRDPAQAKVPPGRDGALPPTRIRIRSRPLVEGSTHLIGAATPAAGQADYEVGYRKPPRHSQFRAGNSGNPRGRPKAAKGLKTIVRETMAAKILVRTADGDKKMSRIEAVLHKTIELAMKGNHRALLQLTTLYGSAVPEAEQPAAAHLPAEDLTASDLAMLEEFKAGLQSDTGDKQ